MRETPNSYLSACLVMVGIRALTVSYNTHILSLQRPSLGKYEIPSRPDKKPTHSHLINRACPYDIYLTSICFKINNVKFINPGF
jgi:hypothetical protein